MILTPERKLMMHKRRIWALVVSMLLLAAMPAIVTVGCGADGTIFYDCYYPLVGRMSHDGQHDDCCHIDPCPCHCLREPCPDDSEKACDAGTDATIPDGGTSSCSGECVPLPPLGGWEGPVLFSLRPEGTETKCPDQAPVIGYQGHDGLNAPSSSGSVCHDLAPAGLPLGSKKVTDLAYEAGTCMPSGGEFSGSLAASGPSTFCCLMG